MFPDIAEYQGTVDWNALAGAHQAGQIEAVMMRVGFGTVRADHQFAANQAGARAHGIPALYYWFCYPTYNTPQAEAAMFNATVGPLQLNEAMCGDFEDDPQSNSTFPRGQAGVDWAKAFLSDLQSPQNASWWYTYPSLLSVIPFQQLYGVWPFWLADYSVTPDSAFTAPIARQFTDCGSTPGVSGCCDQSRVLKAPLSQWLTGGDMTPDEMQARLDAIATAPGQAGFGPTIQAILATIQQVYNAVGGADAHVQAVKAELDTVESQVASDQPVDLTGLKASVAALSKHLGVGTP